MVVQLWFVPCGYPIIDCGQQVWSDRNLALAPHMGGGLVVPAVADVLLCDGCCCCAMDGGEPGSRLRVSGCHNLWLIWNGIMWKLLKGSNVQLLNRMYVGCRPSLLAGSWFLPLLMCCCAMDAVAVRWMRCCCCAMDAVAVRWLLVMASLVAG